MLSPAATCFDDIVRLHWSSIFGFVSSCVRDADIAQDLTQDCFWKASQAWPMFRVDSGVNTWLRHIALNVIRNSVRNKGLQFWRSASSVDAHAEDSFIEDASPSPEAQVIRRDSLCAIWKAAEELSPKQQLALQLRFEEDMDLLEIAAAMEVTDGTVKVHLFRAIQAIRIALHVKSRG